MTEQTVIPLFPSRSLKTTLEFYNALGFETLWEQHSPYVYGSVKYQDILIDFFGSKATEVGQESSHMCLVVVKDIHALHSVFSTGIKQRYGKQLRSGIPRLGTINKLSKDRRFNMLDPDGNRLIMIEVVTDQKVKPRRGTPLLKAVNMARLDAYSRDLPIEAVEYLDDALTRLDDEPLVTQFRAFVLRADIAATLQDGVTLKKCVQAAQAIQLDDSDRAEAAEEIERLWELVLI